MKYFVRFSILFALLLFIGASVLAQSKEPRKVNEFGWIPCEQLRHILDEFLAELQSSPDSLGYAYVYEGKSSMRSYGKRGSRLETFLPAVGEAAYRTNIFRRHFAFRRFDPGRYLFIDGGYRENFSVELWIVPIGVRPPATTPTLDEMKFRRGKPEQIVCEEG